ncbi:DUF1465 family protein [Alterisphingorhabdus coralli]|uniref:DUF1465 family protein n=1 Tax=Alterisphingorhabdus coralli TaxID=3071408 RepID=A0AA97F6Z5_9SPHN|nr:DUF1465 family protein [Parasphingorhabdus sp. SCSIO 66989]WOE75091.1 DUF1465 family protein [Parasphingorhabdus sp. SCSIO 66989]
MPLSKNITPALVDSLYYESMALAEEARAHFSDTGTRDLANTVLSPTRQVELSCESLKVTTRLMHSIAWLLNRKAYFAGELSERQLRAASNDLGQAASSDPDVVATLDPHSRYLVKASEEIFARIERMEERFQQDRLQKMAVDTRLSPALAMQDYLRSSLRSRHFGVVEPDCGCGASACA